jgi:CBS-domain-containing membrane protein
MRGGEQSRLRVGMTEVFWSWLGSFLVDFLMYLTTTLHPPGGTTTLFAVVGGENVHQLGYIYLLIHVALGGFADVAGGIDRQHYRP